MKNNSNKKLIKIFKNFLKKKILNKKNYKKKNNQNGKYLQIGFVVEEKIKIKI